MKPWMIQKILAGFNFFLLGLLVFCFVFLVKSWFVPAAQQNFSWEVQGDSKGVRQEPRTLSQEFNLNGPLLGASSAAMVHVPIEFRGVASVGEKFFAVVEYQGKQSLVREGEKIDEWTIVKISEAVLDLENGEQKAALRREVLFHSPSPLQSQKTSESSLPSSSHQNAMELDQKMVQNILAHWADVLKDVRFVPYTERGKSLGYELLDVTPESAIQKLGFRTGDIVEKINGREVTDLGALLALYENLEKGDLQVDLKRGAQRIQLVYCIKKSV